jgi:hypothetical protein
MQRIEPDDSWMDEEIRARMTEDFERADEEACRAEAIFEKNMILIPELEYMWETEPEYMRCLTETTNV